MVVVHGSTVGPDRYHFSGRSGIKRMMVVVMWTYSDIGSAEEILKFYRLKMVRMHRSLSKLDVG